MTQNNENEKAPTFTTSGTGIWNSNLSGQNTGTKSLQKNGYFSSLRKLSMDVDEKIALDHLKLSFLRLTALSTTFDIGKVTLSRNGMTIYLRYSGSSSATGNSLQQCCLTLFPSLKNSL